MTYIIDPSKVKIGTDAEGFLIDSEGQVVSVEGILGGEKGAPKRIKNGGYLEDCVTWEINPDPVTLEEGASALTDNIISCISAIGEVISPLDLTVDIRPVKLFKPEQLQTTQAMLSGCAPTFDAWSRRRIMPIDLTVSQERYASGDIHISWPDVDDFKFFRLNVVRYLDAIFSMYEVIHSSQSSRSRTVLGAPGVHRPKPYGIEYKTPSNFWIKQHTHTAFLFDLVPEVIRLARADCVEGILSLEGTQPTLERIRSIWDEEEAHYALGDYAEILSGLVDIDIDPERAEEADW